MVDWSRFIALSMRGMLHPINPQHKNCRHRRIYFYSYPYSQDKFRGLYTSINHRNYYYLGIPKADCYLPFIWVRYTKFSKTNRNTPWPRHPCTKTHQDNTRSSFSSVYIDIVINSTINSCCTPSYTRYTCVLRHCISSEGGSPSTTITSKISLQANIIQTEI